MTLWTIQPEELYHSILETGQYVCDPKQIVMSEFTEMYNRLVLQMRERIGEPPEGMEAVEVLKELSEPKPEGFNVAEYMNFLFYVFSGESEEVKLRFDNSLVNTVIDRFGKDIPVIPDDDDHFTVRVTVKAESPFFAWLFLFENKVEIVEPIELKKKYKNK